MYGTPDEVEIRYALISISNCGWRTSSSSDDILTHIYEPQFSNRPRVHRSVILKCISRREAFILYKLFSNFAAFVP